VSATHPAIGDYGDVKGLAEATTELLKKRVERSDFGATQTVTNGSGAMNIIHFPRSVMHECLLI